MVKKVIVLIVIGLPFTAWGFYKPIRVLMPELNGVTCISNTICLDDPNRAGMVQEECNHIYRRSIFSREY